MDDGTVQLISLLLAAALGAAVLATAWSLNRRSWRRRYRADGDWLRRHGIDPGTARRDPAAWRLVLTDELGADGTFTRDLQEYPLPQTAGPPVHPTDHVLYPASAKVRWRWNVGRRLCGGRWVGLPCLPGGSDVTE